MTAACTSSVYRFFASEVPKMLHSFVIRTGVASTDPPYGYNSCPHHSTCSLLKKFLSTVYRVGLD